MFERSVTTELRRDLPIAFREVQILVKPAQHRGVFDVRDDYAEQIRRMTARD